MEKPRCEKKTAGVIYARWMGVCYHMSCWAGSYLPLLIFL